MDVCGVSQRRHLCQEFHRLDCPGGRRRTTVWFMTSVKATSWNINTTPGVGFISDHNTRNSLCSKQENYNRNWKFANKETKLLHDLELQLLCRLCLTSVVWSDESRCGLNLALLLLSAERLLIIITPGLSGLLQSTV